MLRLPKLRYDVPAVKREIVQFLGLNLSDLEREGEFSACENLSSRRYPFLCPRTGRSGQSYSNPTALFAWDGKQVVVDGGVLYYDGKALDNVETGEKQFAVVNTKLCIWPDKAYIDLTDGTFGRLDAEAKTPEGVAGAATLTANTLSMAVDPKIAENLATTTFTGSSNTSNPLIYTYGTDPEAVKACWDGENKQWVGLEELEELTGLFNDDDVDVFMGFDPGRIFIPVVKNNSFVYSHCWDHNGLPDKSGYNTEGYYGIFTHLRDESDDDAVIGTNGSSRLCWKYDIYQVGAESPVLTGVFRVGDVVSVTGTPIGFCDVEKRKVLAIDDLTNTLTFADGTFHIPAAYYKATATLEADGDSAGKFILRAKIDGEYAYRQVTLLRDVEAGQYLVLSADLGTFYVWDKEKKEVLATYAATTKSSDQDFTMTLFSVDGQIVVRRDIPNLDFICESENRLWGVCNEDKTIYASALGDPTNFFVYDGLSTDGYAVAVGSEGDFTGICRYGNGVLCWKEHCLHKVLGSFPAEYQTAFYQYAGVRAGSHKSIVNVNETLFYLGTDGVYAYTGGVPDLISSAFGNRRMSGGVAGTDGLRYFLSAKDENEDWSLLVYDIRTGLWLREDATRAGDFCRIGDRLCYLSENTVYTMDTGDESVVWSATLKPFYETIQGRKRLSKVYLQVEVPRGSWMQAEVRCDGKKWQVAARITGETEATKVIPIVPNRCDKFEIRLSGRGACCIRSMLREFRVGSEM